MQKKIWALIVSMMVFIGAIPGMPVFAEPESNITLNVGYGGVVNGEIKSDEEGSFGYAGYFVDPGDEVTFTATADEAHYFIGWSTSPSEDDVFLKDSTYKLTPEDDVKYDIYALFEEYIIVTFHFGTIENPDIIEPVDIIGTVGTHHGEFTASDEFKAAQSELMAEFGFETAYFETPRTKSLKEIVAEEAYDSYFLDVDDRIFETSDVYETLMLPITSVNVTLDPPVAGKTNETLPVITVPDGVLYSFPPETEDLYSSYWFDPDNTEEAYDVTFECGNTYYARFCLRADTGYYFDLTEETVTVNNDKPYQIDEEGFGEHWMEAPVTLEHSWSDWETIKEATATDNGIMRRTCSVCNAVEEDKIVAQPADAQPADVQPDNEQAGEVAENTGLQNGVDSVANTGNRYTAINTTSIARVVDGLLEVWNGEAWIVAGPASEDGFAHIEGGEGYDPYDNFTGAAIVNNTAKTKVELYRSDDLLYHANSNRAVGAARKGSLIIDLYPEYIQTLEAGDYTFTAYFNDGESVSFQFTVVAAETTPAADANKAGSNVPSTGEGISISMIWGAVLVSIAVVGAGIVLEKKKLGKKDVK